MTRKFAGLLVCWLVVGVSVAVAQERQRPSLFEIEPDTADLPDSPFPVPPGVALFETSLTIEQGKDADRARTLSTASLVRFGIARNWELRLSGDGWMRERTRNGRRKGMGDLVVGFKRHIFAESGARPAFGIIAQLNVPTASAGFGSGALEPTLFFNFGKELPAGFGMEWNIGVNWLKGNESRSRFVQYNLLWVLEKDLGRGVGVFVHGLADFPAEPKAGSAVVLGPGVTWLVNDRVQLDASFTFGLTRDAPNKILRFGLAVLR